MFVDFGQISHFIFTGYWISDRLKNDELEMKTNKIEIKNVYVFVHEP